MVVDRIRELGFRQWYERELIFAHLWLVTCFLGMVVVLAGVEVLGIKETLTQNLAGLALGIGGGLVSLYSWARYQARMTLAERLGDHATCGRCGTYAIFKVLSGGDGAGGRMGQSDDDSEDDPGGVWLRVRCKRCEHEWAI